MRHYLPLALFFLLISEPVYACQGDGASIFFDSVPDPRPEADLIAIVSVSDKADNTKSASQTSIATVIQVIKSSDARVKQGSTIPMRYRRTSCGPDPLIGSKGMIIAKTGADSRGSLVVHPYAHSRSGRIDPPVILPDGYDMSPPPLEIGQAVPENFAVILIGVVGTESLDFLRLDHSVPHSAMTMFRPLPGPPKGIVAVAVPIGIKQLSISYVTTGRRRAGYRSDDTVFVNTPKLDIDRPGVYYIATLDTSNPQQFQIHPLTEQLKQFHTDYAGTVKGLEPINFKWPTQ